MNVDMSKIVMASVDIDCDGTGYAYQRVSVPKFLAREIQETQNELIAQRSELADLRSNESLSHAIQGGMEELERLTEKISRVDKEIVRQGNIKRGLNQALDSWLQESEQITNTSIWHPLSAEEGECLIKSLEGFDLTYWNDNGYHSYFNAR